MEGTGHKGGVFRSGKCCTMPGPAPPQAFPVPGGAFWGKRGRGPAICWPGIGHGGWLSTRKRWPLARVRGAHFHKVLGQLRARQRRAPRGRGPWTSRCFLHTFRLDGGGPLEGVLGPPLTKGRRRRSRLPGHLSSPP